MQGFLLETALKCCSSAAACRSDLARAPAGLSGGRGQITRQVVSPKPLTSLLTIRARPVNMHAEIDMAEYAVADAAAEPKSVGS